MSQELDSTVETIYYEGGAEKIRELEQNIACLEKYIKELETSVHLQRTQNAVLRNKVDNIDLCTVQKYGGSVVI